MYMYLSVFMFCESKCLAVDVYCTHCGTDFLFHRVSKVRKVFLVNQDFKETWDPLLVDTIRIVYLETVYCAD